MIFIDWKLDLKFSGLVTLTRVARNRPGFKIIDTITNRNAITNVAHLVDLINGTSGNHVNSSSNMRIKDSIGTTVKLMTSMDTGYPQEASAGNKLFVGGWADETADTYNPDDCEYEDSTGTKIAESLNVSWPNKPADENWYFEWEISLSEGVDADWNDAGLDLMLHLITGNSAYHFAFNNWEIDVYDGEPGTFDKMVPVQSTSQPTSTSLKGTFFSSGGAAVWSWVKHINNRGGSDLLIYDDQLSNKTQGADDEVTYTATISYS
jgi:hypothetical protein